MFRTHHTISNCTYVLLVLILLGDLAHAASGRGVFRLQRAHLYELSFFNRCYY